jgi:hypothetical protein
LLCILFIPVKHKVEKKIGRNDKVQVQKGSETKIVKYKKVDSLIKEGWQLID